MIVYQTIGEVAQAWIFALRALGRPQVREPFFVVGGLQLILLLALGNFHAVALAGFLAPVVRALGGEAALHYPDHFWALPEIYRSANTAFGIFFTYTAWGVATIRFAGEQVTWQEVIRRAPNTRAGQERTERVQIGTLRAQGAAGLPALVIVEHVLLCDIVGCLADRQFESDLLALTWTTSYFESLPSAPMVTKNPPTACASGA